MNVNNSYQCKSSSVNFIHTKEVTEENILGTTNKGCTWGSVAINIGRNISNTNIGYNQENSLQLLRDVKMTFKPSKCASAKAGIQFVGHKVRKRQWSCLEDKIHKIQDAPSPQTNKYIRSFIVLAGYYSRFVPNFGVVASLLFELKKRAPNQVVWDPPEDKSFWTLKSLSCKEPILQLPGPSRPFIHRTDAQSDESSAVLLQEKDGDNFPVACHSRKLKQVEKTYSTTDRELLTVVDGIRKSEFYLYGDEFILQTDRMPLESFSYLKECKL